MLTVVMQHGVVERVDALEILRIERVLGADAVTGRSVTEIGLQQLQDRPEDRQARQAQLLAMVLQARDQIVLEQGIKDDARRLLDLGEHAVELLLACAPADRHARPACTLVYCAVAAARHGGQRLAGGVRR